MDVTSEIPSVVSLLEQIDTAFGTLYVIIDLANAVLSSSFGNSLHLQGRDNSVIFLTCPRTLSNFMFSLSLVT